METIRPMSDDEFTTIDGVGKAKLENMEMLYKNYNISKKKTEKPKKKLAPIKKHYYYFKMDLQLGDRIKT
jgi:ATP-dependent DNA helicase RecQ